MVTFQTREGIPALEPSILLTKTQISICFGLFAPSIRPIFQAASSITEHKTTERTKVIIELLRKEKMEALNALRNDLIPPSVLALPDSGENTTVFIET